MAKEPLFGKDAVERTDLTDLLVSVWDLVTPNQRAALALLLAIHDQFAALVVWAEILAQATSQAVARGKRQ